jgi:biopolymer transport protein ExbD
LAGNFTPGRPGAIIEGINVTPLVDIMLVLLVIFIVTAKILVTPAMSLDLPKAVKTEEVQVVFAVGMPATGATLVNGVPVGDDTELGARAAAALAADRDLRAVIQADGSVPHQRVIRVMDVLRRAGLSKVAFATQPDSPARSEPGR